VQTAPKHKTKIFFTSRHILSAPNTFGSWLHQWHVKGFPGQWTPCSQSTDTKQQW